MRHSLVTRLTLLIATVIVIAFVALLLVMHRATSETFVHSQQEVLSALPNHPSNKSLVLAIETAHQQGDWPAVQDLLDRLPSQDESKSIHVIILDNVLRVVATTDTFLLKAEVHQDENDVLHLSCVSESEGEISEFELTTWGTTVLTDQAGIAIGQFVPLATPIEKRSGDRFARQVWQAAAGWLVMTLLLAMAVTAILLRRSLRPLNQLTQAAWDLQNGHVPPPLENTGDAEFEKLIGAFNSATQSIAQTENMRRQLISDIAHELRTPLTNIRGQIEAAEAGLVPPGKDLFSTLRAETRLLERLVEDFQELAIFDAGQLRIHTQSLPLKEISQNILQPMVDQAAATLEIDASEKIHVRADEERLRQVLGNLMENAVRHRPVDLKICLTAQADDNHVRIFFADNGSGVAQHHQPFIFERFYRGEKSRNRSTGGSGLGLAIVKAILEAMQGTIRYIDESPSGAKFEIRLPRAFH